MTFNIPKLLLFCSITILSADEFQDVASDTYQVTWSGYCKIADLVNSKGGRTLDNPNSNSWSAAMENCANKGGTLWPFIYPANI